MGILGKMGDMYRLQKEAKRVKKELSNIHVVSEVKGVKVTVDGQQEILSVEFLDGATLDNPTALGKATVEAMNKAVKKSQAVAAEKMKDIMGGLQGMMGQ